MKKHLLTSLLLILSTVATFGQIVNGGFENWASAGNCSNPTGWGTLNGSTGILGICTAQRNQTTVHTGSSSLLINTQFIGFPINQTAPGIVTNGTINTTTEAVEGGDPFNERPTSFTGWYQATPVNGDTYSYSALLINEATGDTVGTASFEGTTVVNTWTMFNAPVTYTHPENPTLLQIILLPSEGLNPQVGSVAIFDDLGYESISVGISEIETSMIRTYPNPISSEVYFNLGSIEMAFVEIYDMVGKKVLERSLTSIENRIELGNMSNGHYVWEISTMNGEFLKSGKLSVNK